MVTALAAHTPPPQLGEAMDTLKSMLGDRISTAHAVREQHGKDISHHPAGLPDAVAFAESVDEVADIVKVCARHAIPIIPFGTGTSLEGHIAAPLGGLSLDVSRMDKIVAVHAEDLDAVVQPGVTRKTLNTHLRDTGLFFPIDPGADASLGGMSSTRASGTNAVRYGTMRENVMALQVVTPDGRIIRTGGRSRKSAAGYDLTRLYVGSEGTLGIITEVTLRLYGIPEKIAAAVCAFDTLEGAVNAVICVIQMGIPIARIELMDDEQMRILNNYAKLGYSQKNTLFMEFHGTEAGVKEQAEMVQDIASDNGGGGFSWTTDAEERTKLWQARHDVAWANKEDKPGWGFWATDVCVPISRLADVILETKEDVQKEQLTAPLLGHVGDGNFHMTIMVKPNDAEYLARVEAVNDRMIERALAAGGTSTGEHGIGLGKMKFLRAEHGESVQLMQDIKRALDPQNIMNPSKIFGPSSGPHLHKQQNT
ncbi:MAG TPA: FAD-binding oxidoreductase [Rhodospirillaceae bacterium]|nr:FAD-binding oxidoreductase [Candidatus Neomarinimicrobiota bacterium]HCX13752.1 FAD-binding oxidoreductase [Rhodospirillaceae bacterium]